MDGYVYHSRKECAENSFKYPILNIYFNVLLEEQLHNVFKTHFKRILSFSSESYLDHKKQSTDTSIRHFLKSNFEYDPDSIFLQTIPKMFGYAFNPVSFWYCFKNNTLSAVLCEVSNTFQEKHYYWIYQDGRCLNREWVVASKAFHVSPFFQIEGYYKFRFINEASKLHVDIQYFNLDHTLKLNTWMSGTLKVIDSVSVLKLLLKFGWFTPLVVFKIHYQALKLFFKKVKFYSKPKPPLEEITRESSIVRH